MFGRKAKAASDEQLMQQVCAGHQQAFNELYGRYKQRLYYYFFRMLGNSEELANDFLQDVFLKIVENPRRFDPRYPFKTWVFSIAFNLCKNEYRRREIRKTTPVPEKLVQPDQPENLSKEALISRIFETLEELSAEHHSVFIMHYREGFSLKEIAGMLGLAPGTVKSRLFYTRKFLANKFQHLKDEIEL